MRDDEYCGFLCSDIIERQQAIINDLKDFSEYNKEFAEEMFIKILKMCNAAVSLKLHTS